ncbi:hypothetical protein [Yanshouia hominis]|uniref:Uncharacterized protein n=1 Tax=Yanshouia hominis TaxID=2763673 RepID=A0ABR7NL16_9FIRM|nr:hypothetical protein [Yanshouia hominis]MBC8577019.1 hypothetical protein [Yanshouia hominis]
MNETTARADLLDELYRHSGCGFLSDLPREENREGLQRALLAVEPDSFSMKAWEEAVFYLCGSRKHFEAASAARDYLIRKIGCGQNRQ